MTNSMQVEFRSGEDVAGRVCDQHGTTWSFASWLDLLSLIERLRIDQGDSSTMYAALTCDEVPIAIEGDGVEFRRTEIGGDLSVAFVRVAEGTDFRPALAGLPGDRCQCPHWGYMLRGRITMHTAEGELEYTAGQAFYWGPGHAPVALEDSEFVEFSPTGELDVVVDHITSNA